MSFRFVLLGVHLVLLTIGWSVPVQAADVTEDHPERIRAGLKLFDEAIESLLTSRCLECHNAADLSGGLDLSSHDGLIKGGERGPAILLKRPQDSLLLKLITRHQEPHMPPEGPAIAGDDVARILKWIELGAPFRRSLDESQKSATEDWTRSVIKPEDRDFWSFRPLYRPAIPQVRDQEAIGNEIDAFIIAAQEAHGLTMAKRADRRTLIRRLSLDLTGLPPSPEEVRDFEMDAHPAAYSRLVDRLLSAPQFGEHWARHWLDIARFAESHGFEHDYDRPTAFHYRDFVVQAMNDNLPYDDFVRWQIAGDEIAPANRLAWMATGFLAAGVHSTQITKNEVERHRYDELDDMVGTLGTALLGLTIGCARCHDHKYDPIPQADYYRLVSAFTSTVRSEVELDFDPEAYAREKRSFDDSHQIYLDQLQSYERAQLPGKLARWLESPAASMRHSDWLLPETLTIHSDAGTQFKKLPDESWLATGAAGDHDFYTLKLTTAIPLIQAIRIEALTDLSLQHGGPGRASNGNFALSHVEVLLPSEDDNQPPRKIMLSQARSTFDQVGLPVAAAIDDNPTSAWAIDPQFGRHHAAVFDFKDPLTLNAPTTLEVRLHFHCNTQHTIGRIRFSLAESSGLPADNTRPFDATLDRVLATPHSSWSRDERERALTWFRTQDPDWQALDQARAEHAAKAPKPHTQKVLVATEGRPAIVLHTQAPKEFLDATHFLRRGDPEQKAGTAAPGVLQILSKSTEDTPSNSIAPWFVEPHKEELTSGRRRAVAYWLTDVEHGAGALLARVAVNRLWQHHFGQGIVSTPSDFGRRGATPVHPDLLEWMAAELIDHDWDLKHIHRLIVTSRTYQSQSQGEREVFSLDPENKWLTRWQPRRLTAEALRDTVLLTAEQLDQRMYGAGTLAPHPRRSLYFTIKRSQLVPMLTVFDAPDGTVGVAERPQTVVAPQALWLLNDPVVTEAATRLAQAAIRDNSSEDLQLRWVYRQILQRLPTQREAVSLQSYLNSMPPEVGLREVCRTLYCLPEFQWVE